VETTFLRTLSNILALIWPLFGGRREFLFWGVEEVVSIDEKQKQRQGRVSERKRPLPLRRKIK
jgi:hypothetical protein